MHAAHPGAFGSKGAFRLISSSKDRGVLMDTTPISMINCTDPDFTPVFSSKSFPNVTLKDDGYGFNESSCHMLALCMKVGSHWSVTHPHITRIFETSCCAMMFRMHVDRDSCDLRGDNRR